MARTRRTPLLLSLALAAPATLACAAPVEVGAPSGFVVVPARRAAVFGYSAQGLEVWAYPLQLISDYHLRFQEPSRTTPLDGQALLRRVEVGADGTATRVYVGPDFVVRERLSVAPDAPAARVDYDVEGRPDVRIEVRFKPSLNLMWPAAVGGQDLGWDEGRHGYVEREAQHGFSALIASPQAVAHDATVNDAVAWSDERALVLQPAGDGAVRRATLNLQAGLDAPPGADPDPGADATPGMSLHTPDPVFDAAVRDAARALDQAWVCAPRIGCGEVAGYGPSRPGRRPQYDWFFGGDGLVAAEGLMAAGRYERARDELAFVARFQNPANGMIWHEMSMSAPYVDWARYPYMYVHVDITLQYLATLGRYEATTGDGAFLARAWPNVTAAWRYADGLLDARTGLPAIPPGKEGQDEQARLADDVRLSSAWIDAADAMAALDARMGRDREAAAVRAQATRARAALGRGAWDAGRGFWIEGHGLDGRPVRADRSDAIGLLDQDVFTPAEVDAALDHLSTPAFRTDWGERSLSAAAPDYDPNAYSAGAVWALGSSAAARADWRAHRPQVGWSLLQGLADWNTLDSPGRLHEVLAGDLYHPELESAPAQTWSSAALLLGAVDGLLGVKIDGAAGRLAFAPHLPGDWDHAEVEGLRVGGARMALRLTRDAQATVLDVDDQGPPVAVDFDPEIPLGAMSVSCEVAGRPAPVLVEPHPQDLHARLAFTARPGRTRVVIRYRGGVRLAPGVVAPRPGDASRNLQIAAVRLERGRLEVDGYVADPDRAEVALLTPWTVASVTGGATRTGGDGRVLLTLTPPAGAPLLPGGYRAVSATVVFAPPAGARPGG